MRILWLSIAALSAACAAEVTGPEPSLQPPGAGVTPAPVDPSIICRDQLTTKVTVTGEHFSPIPIDIPKDPKTALPDISLTRSKELAGKAVSEAEPVLYSGDPDKDPTNAYASDKKTPLLTWKSQQSMTFTVNQNLTLPNGSVGMLNEGIYDITVTNPDSKEATSPGSLAVVDKPTLQEISPSIVCLDEETRSVVLTGDRFLGIGKGKAEVEIDGATAPFVLALDDCVKIKQAGLDAEFCKTATVSLPPQSVPIGYPALTVQNPETADCISVDAINLRVVPKPAIDRVVPVLGCLAEGARSFEIQGSNLLRIDGVPPAVQVGGKDFAVDSTGGCVELEAMGQKLETCSSITITIAQEALAPDLYNVMVANPDPAGCSQTAVGALRITPPPTMEGVDPSIICVDQSDREITLLGSDFLTVDGVVPKVEIGDYAIDPDKIAADECAKLETPQLDVRSCKKLVVSIDQGSLKNGLYNIVVTNPDPAGCSDTGTGLLRVVDGPEVTAVEPALVCTDDGARNLVIAGTGFLNINGALPLVTIGGDQVAVDSADDCKSIDVGDLAVKTCSTLNVTVARKALSEGRPAVTVDNPAPAGCSTGNDAVLTVPPAVTITSAAPSNLCSAETAATEVAIHGTGFLRLDGEDFALKINGSAVAPAGISDCTDLVVAGMKNVRSCNTVTAAISPSTLSVGDILVEIANPSPSGCGATASSVLRIVNPPTVNSVSPTEVCSDVQTTVTVYGTGFVPGAAVKMGETYADSVQFVSENELFTTFSDGVPAGIHYVTVENAAGCVDQSLVTLTGHPTPVVFFVDPPVIYNQLAMEVTIFTTGLAATAAKVDLVDASENVTNLDFISPKRPNRIQAAIPGEGTLAAGQYEVRVTSEVGCVGFLPGALTITDSLTMGDLSVDPSFASPTKPTAVTITVDTSTGKAGFEPIPRVYLNPTTPGSTATALRAVEMADETTLTAVIPEDLDPGTYDLIVVNPSGEVGVAESAVTVTVKEPPVIKSVTPASFVANAIDEIVTIRGENFDGVTQVQLICKNVANAVAGTTIATVDPQTVTAHFNISASGLSAGSICRVELTNADGSSFSFSAISITNSSRNLANWSNDSPAMLEARRALSLVAARPTATSRYLYAIGGDSGATGNAQTIGTVKSSIESARVDVYGEMSPWSMQHNSLPEARTWAGVAHIDRFIYLVGGQNGTAATNNLYRAQVLDPLAGPEILDLDAELGDGTEGLAGGRWYYRVAATFPASDANNPGGESIAGEVLNVQLPDNPKKIKLLLMWEEVARANGYRVYRSPTVDGSVDDLELLYEVTCGTDTVCDCVAVPETCQYQDIGAGTTAEAPLPPGSLGVWSALSGSTLNTPREAHATVAAPDLTTTGRWFIYAFGGRDNTTPTPLCLDTYEYAVVTVNLDGTQTVSAWTLVDGSGPPGSPTKLSSARAELEARALSEKDGSVIGSTEVWIYVGVGRTTGGALSNNMDANVVGASGDLGQLQAVNRTPTNYAGYGFGNANNQLFMFGGAGGGASSGGISAELCVVANCLPDLQPGAWNSLGNGAPIGTRVYMGSAQESAFFFLAGGHNGANALATTEQTVQ